MNTVNDSYFIISKYIAGNDSLSIFYLLHFLVTSISFTKQIACHEKGLFL